MIGRLRSLVQLTDSSLASPLGRSDHASTLYSMLRPRVQRLMGAAEQLVGCSSSTSTWGGRSLHQSASAAADEQPSSEESISVTFVDRDGKDVTCRAPIGKNLLEVAHDNEVDLEGACEGSLACSTCHVIVEDEDLFKKLPEASEDELDMLDLAFGLTDTSRLGCQVIASKDVDGMRVRLPSATRNFYVDGHKPKPH